MSIVYWEGTTDTNYSVATNWSTGAVPIAGDDVYFTDNAKNVVLGLNQSAVVLASFHVSQSYTGTISGTDGEYLQIASPILEVGEKIAGVSGSGSSQIKLDLGTTTACEVNITNTGTSSTGEPALDLKANNASTDLNIKSGTIGLGSDLLASVVGTINMHGGTLLIADAVTMTKLNQSNGTCESLSNLPDLDSSGGTLTLSDGATTITTAKLTGTAQLDLETSGALTVTTIEVISGTLNALVMNAVTFTNLKVAPTAQINLDMRFVTLTNDVLLLTTESSKRYKIQF